MALEAKLEFSEQANRSRMIATRLESLARELGAQPSFEAIQRAVRTAMRWKVAEADQWREGAGRRRLSQRGLRRAHFRPRRSAGTQSTELRLPIA